MRRIHLRVLLAHAVSLLFVGCFNPAKGTGNNEQPDASINPIDAALVTEELVVRYLFDEGSGSVVNDSSGNATALELTIEQPGSVSWANGGLQINTPSIVRAANSANRIYDAVVATQEFTIEAVIEPTTLTSGTPPGRIVTYSQSEQGQNFFLGQTNGSHYDFRLENAGGTEELTTPMNVGDVQLALTHLAARYESSGVMTIWVNGVQRGEATVLAPLDWSNTHRFALANEQNYDLGHDRHWLGIYHQIALYRRALGDNEIRALAEQSGIP